MEEPIEYFSIDEAFWVKFAEHQISFSFGSLLKDVHFTIVFGIKHGQMNFHITKNGKGSDGIPPFLRILQMDRQILEQNQDFIIRAVFRTILVQLEMSNSEEINENTVRFLSFDQLKKSENYTHLERQIFESLKSLRLPYRKKRLKITAQEEKVQMAFSNLPLLEKAINDHAVNPTKDKSEKLESGIIFDDIESKSVIKYGDKWYGFNKELTMLNLLSALMPLDLAKHIIKKTLRSIIHVRNANSQVEINHLNKPITVVFKVHKEA